MERTLTAIYEEIGLTEELMKDGVGFRFKAPKPGEYYDVYGLHGTSLWTRRNITSSKEFHALLINISERGFTLSYKLLNTEITKAFLFSQFEVDTKINVIVKRKFK